MNDLTRPIARLIRCLIGTARRYRAYRDVGIDRRRAWRAAWGITRIFGE